MSVPIVSSDDIRLIKMMDPVTADMLTAVIDLGLWETVRDFTGKSFMYHAPKDLDKLDTHPLVAKYGHSGASFGMCLRNVQFIAKNGVDAYLAICNSGSL